MDGAKLLRAGCHTALERLDHLNPVLEEFFHIQQDLLEVSISYMFIYVSNKYRNGGLYHVLEYHEVTQVTLF